MDQSDLRSLLMQCRLPTAQQIAEELDRWLVERGNWKGQAVADVGLDYKVVGFKEFSAPGDTNIAVYGWEVQFRTAGDPGPDAWRRIAADLSFLLKIKPLWITPLIKRDYNYTTRKAVTTCSPRSYSLLVSSKYPFRRWEYLGHPVAKDELQRIFAALKYLERLTLEDVVDPEPPPPPPDTPPLHWGHLFRNVKPPEGSR